MTLEEIRKKFRDLTGRTDLVGPQGSDMGADFFINAAQRWLDRKLEFRGGAAELSVALSTGDYSADLGAHTSTVSGLRAVKSVGVEDSDGDFQFLEREDYKDLKKHTQVASSSDNGTPRSFAIGRLAPANRTESEIRVLFWPPVEGSHTLVVEGLFSSTELQDDSDRSWWSEVHPLILVKAAAFRMEAMQRNTQGESDYRRSLMEDLQGIDHDMVEQDIAGRDQVDNTWRNINR